MLIVQVRNPELGRRGSELLEGRVARENSLVFVAAGMLALCFAALG